MFLSFSFFLLTAIVLDQYTHHLLSSDYDIDVLTGFLTASLSSDKSILHTIANINIKIILIPSFSFPPAYILWNKKPLTAQSSTISVFSYLYSSLHVTATSMIPNII